ncbi:class I SAM-dependent methyltransferase [Microvirga soli]|uniref:class I SAM-dependent methyltransferase n=1 Tax=Microvirga soli TaxID=1854496 RepID=UPI00191FF794|nr:class I SAM-dependent methyltransferase [Microvirga soli]
MERLGFDKTTPYSAIEAAIHAARYAVAKPICEGRRVLDIACGEGYGSALLKDWGADSVHGVDISEDAIASARANFTRSGIDFKVGRAEDAATLLDRESYDLVISLETFEHLDDPRVYLRQIKSLAKSDAVIIISCPNDHWYYPLESQGNPFHKRKYTFDECREICEEILGPAAWRFGGLTVGFMAAAGGAPQGTHWDQTAMMNYSVVPNTIMLPPDPDTAPEHKFSSFFVGIWGAPDLPLSAAIYPTSMKVLETGLFPDTAARLEQAKRDVEQSNRDVEQSKRDVEQSKRDVRIQRLRNQALESENSLLREGITQTAQLNRRLSSENAKLQKKLAQVPWRAVGIYRRVRSHIPQPAMKLIGRGVTAIKALRK